MALSWRDGPWVADTSAWARAHNPAVAPKWKAAAEAAEIIGCPVVTLELLAAPREHCPSTLDPELRHSLSLS